MGETISIRLFGRSSSSFSDRLPLGPRFLLLGLMALVLAALLILQGQFQAALRPVEAAVRQAGAVGDLAWEVVAARLSAERFLGSGALDDYRAGEAALNALVERLDAAPLTSPALNYLLVQNLVTAGVDYAGAFRALGGGLHGDADGPAEAQIAMRQSLDSATRLLDAENAALFNQSLAGVEESLQSLAGTMQALILLVLALLIVGFALSTVLVVSTGRRTTASLRGIGQAANELTMGNFGARIDLVGERDPAIRQLALAFNRMAENLALAMKSETAANEQNRVHLLKLARQERVTAILEERQRIARELHDSVKQQLFSITLSAGAVQNLLTEAPEQVKLHLEHIKQAGHYAQSEMTALVQELAPVPLQDKRLEDALLDYLNPLCEAHRLKLLWRVEGTNTLTIAQEHALFRAVQEAVANVVRHSGASILRVSLTFGLLTHVIVDDNGQGFVADAVPPTSTGLSMMRTRLRRVGGRYELQTAPGEGTRLSIMLDLRRKGLL
ncbi:MAG: HAMP domain-containing sensor histidine kinase [Chloroflexi bacterium]|nr:HAMP domain-containing sensor histidine kinase [Chloroflexota bacterium]